MPAAHLASILRRLGFAFILAVVVQVRVDDRLVLLPFTGALLAWAVWRVRPLVESAEADRAWRGAFGSAVAGAVVAVLGLIPAVEPGFASVLISILLLLGTISHCSLMSGWSLRAGWADAAHAYEQARSWCTINLFVVAVGVAALVVLGERPIAGERGSIVPGIVLGRIFEGIAVVVAVVIVAVVWVAAMVALQLANRKVRAAMAEQPDSVVPLA